MILIHFHVSFDWINCYFQFMESLKLENFSKIKCKKPMSYSEGTAP